MNKIFIIAAAGAFALVAGCGKSENTSQMQAGGAAVRSAGASAQKTQLDLLAEKYFPDSPELQEQWKKKQMVARAELMSFVPDMPAQEYARLRARAEARYPEDFCERIKYVRGQASAFAEYSRACATLGEGDARFVKKAAEDFAPDNYAARLKLAEQWRGAFSAMKSRRENFSAEEYDTIKKEICEKFANNPDAAAAEFYKQAVAKRSFDSYALPVAQMREIKEDVAKIEGHDYVAKLAELKKRAEQARRGGKSASAAPNAEQQKREENIYKFAEKVFRESIFTMRGAEEEIIPAVLAQMNGKPVVLCTKHFIPEKFPVVLSNGTGKIKCSKAYVSETHPMILLIPDELPPEFKPLKLAGAGGAPLPDRELCMIAPTRGGLASFGVSVFSEDNEYINLTSSTNPHIENRISVRRLDRDGKRLLISLSEIIEVGDNSVIIDANSGELVSMAVRIYNPGVLSFTGKTGSIIGHEKAPIPDFTTFMRQFDGTASKTFAPRSSIRFVRISAFEGWKPLDIDAFNKQKKEIAYFTDENNDFLMFFKRNLFDEALHSRRLARIAGKYRHHLLEERLTGDSYERFYRNYMLEVSYALKRELVGNKKPENFYSIYRQEFKYQLKLREAMYTYLADALADKNIFNIIHYDLRGRYNNCSHNNGRLGGSIGGGY